MYKSNEILQTEEKQPWEIINDIINRSWICQAVYVTARLGIADILKDGKQSIDKIAKLTNTDSSSLFRVMRLLSGIGIFHQEDGRIFSNTSLSEVLETTHPNSMRYAAIYLGSPYHWNAWGNILYSIQTGKSAFRYTNNMDFFTYLSQHEEDADVFNESMTKRTHMRIKTTINSYDFSNADTIIDIGGGKGTLISAILKKYPLKKGIVYDMDTVIPYAKHNLSQNNLLNRCDCISGNFFESVPASGDLYILSSILHDWNDTEALSILKNCRHAMKKDARLIITETIVSDTTEAEFSKAIDLEMLITFEGKERTLEEYRTLLKEAGFTISNIFSDLKKETELCIIECCPV